jgi:ribonuclease HII
MPGRRRRAGSARRRWSVIERELRRERGPLIAGVDEVGRGPLAGPVVACAVVMPPDERAIVGVDDSKRLIAAERVRLAAKIRERAVALGVGAASVREIDRLNIYHATVLAMRRALGRLAVTPNHVVLDGNPIRTLTVPHTAVVGGDHRCYSIACASIVAKITRDRIMRALATRHPQYRWETNVGYATGEHFRGMDAHGVTKHHRRSFLPVSQLSLGLDMRMFAQSDDDELEGLLQEESPGLALPAFPLSAQSLPDTSALS